MFAIAMRFDKVEIQALILGCFFDPVHLLFLFFYRVVQVCQTNSATGQSSPQTTHFLLPVWYPRLAKTPTTPNYKRIVVSVASSESASTRDVLLA